MTLDNRLRAAADDTRNRVGGLTPPPVPHPHRLLRATVGTVVAVAAVALIAIVWRGLPSTGPQPPDGATAMAGRVVAASLQPVGLSGELNQAVELVSLDGQDISDLEIRSLVVDDAATLWVSVAQPAVAAPPASAQLFSYNGQEWRVLEAPFPVYGVLAGDKEVIWVATFEGVARFDGESWEQYTPDDGVPISFISSASIGPEGELWIFSVGYYFRESINDPLQRLEEPTVAMFDGREWHRWEALTNEGVEAGVITTGPDGSVWVASSDARWGEGEPGGVWTLDGDEWVQVWEPTKSLDFFSAIAVDDDGELWGAYREYVLHLYQDGSRLYDATDGVGNVLGHGAAIGWRPTDIEIADDAIWVATLGGGLSRFDGATWQTFNTDEGLPNDRVTEVELGPDGMLWLRLGRDGDRIVAYNADR